MSEEIFQSEIRRMLPLSCSRGQHNAPLPRNRNTCILNVSEFHQDCGRVRFEIDEFNGVVPLDRKDSIAG